jgi:phage terminase small subunit
MTDNGALTAAQKRFVAALLTARDVRGACRVAGVAERTAYRWLRMPAVKAALAEAQDTALAQVTRLAVGMMTDALGTLAAVMGDNDAPTASRVAAARAILENVLRFTDAVTLAERVAKLEERLGGAE